MQNCHLVVGTEECPINAIYKIIRQSRTFQDNWSSFARELLIPNHRIKAFRHDEQMGKITDSDLIYDLLDIWVAKEGSNAQLTSIIKAVEEIEENEKLRLEFNLPCKALDENQKMKWDEVGVPFQRKVIDNLASLYPGIEFNDFMANVQADVLIQLMTGENPTIFKSTVPKEISYYIKRKVSTRHIISTTIYKEGEYSLGKDVFIFGGMDLSELAKEVKGLTSHSRNFNSNSGARYVSLDMTSDANKIIRKTEHPVHVLKKEVVEEGRDYRLRWVKSRGEMESIQRHVDCSQDDFDEEDFIKSLLKSSENSSLPVCIGDTPGMGKSILLAKIGNRIRDTQPDKTVFFIVLHEIIKLIKKDETTDKPPVAAIEKALQNTVCANLIGETVLQFMLNSNDEKVIIELLFDGFDEVDDADMQLAHEILKTIKTSFKAVRLWVTTRPHFLEELESSLSVLGCNIRPFIKEDQVEFLTSFWSSRKTALDSSKLKKFAKHCLKSLKKKMNSKDEDIAGIPLQCLLIGEVYEDDAFDYVNNQVENYDIHAMPEIEVGSITCLYQELIQKKYLKYKSIESEKTKLTESEMMTMHASLSVQLIFPDHFRRLGLIFDPVQIEELLKIGVVEAVSTSDTPRFIHRTFAEYIVARFVVEKLKCIGGWTEELNDFFLNGILKTKRTASIGIQSFEFAYPVIAYFTNFLIDSNSSQERVYNCVTTYKIARRLAHSCVSSDYANLFNFLHRVKMFDRQAATIFDRDFALHAIGHSSLELVRAGLDLFERYYKFDVNIQIKTLREAAKRGDFSLVEFLIKEKELGKLLEDLDLGAWSLMHDCITQTSGFPEWGIEEMILVIRFLVYINPKLLHEKDDSGLSPLFSRLAHVRLITELVNLGANVLSKNNYGDTILHTSGADPSWLIKDYHEFLKNIPAESLRELVHIKDSGGYTPLFSLISRVAMFPETIEIFKEAGAHFSDQQHSLLGCAMHGGQDKNTFRQLIASGADVKWKGGNSNVTVLHIAAELGNLNAVEVLLDLDSQIGINVNEEDDEGLTPLNYAIRYCGFFDHYGNRYEAGMALYRGGAKFKNIITSEGMTLLHVAAKQGNIHSVRLLTDMGLSALDVNETDGMGNTPLHYCMVKCYGTGRYANESKPYLPIAHHLLDNKADPSLANKFGETPFHTALKNYELDLDVFHLLMPTTFTPELAVLTLKFIFIIAVKRELNNEELVATAAECVKVSDDIWQQLFEGKNIFDQEASEFFDENFLYLVAERTGLAIFKLALHIFERAKTIDDIIWENLLHNSAQGGKYSIFEYLIQEKELHRIIKKMNPTTSPNLIHDCVNQTATMTRRSDEAIEERLKLIRLICSINPTLLSKCHPEHSASLSYNVHNQLRDELAKLDRNISQDLHNFVGSSEDYHSFILVIPEQQLKKLVSERKGESNETPLAFAVRTIDTLPKTIDIFQKAGANFNFTYSDGYSLLATAISNNRSLETLRKLVASGAKIDWKGTKKSATLLHIAAKFGNLEAIQFLTEKHNMDVNVQDKDGLTPLDYAICSSMATGRNNIYSHHDWIETGMTLKYLGGMFKENYSSKRTLLHIAAKRGKADSVELLVQLGMDVNGRTRNGNTPLHLAQRGQERAQWFNRHHHDGYYRTTKLLLLNNACPRTKNNNGKTPIDIAFKNENLDLQTLLLFKSKADIEWTPERAEFALRTVLTMKRHLNSFIDKEEFSLLIREMLDRGVDANFKDKDGHSLLYIAIEDNLSRTVKYLVEEKHANVNLQCSSTRSIDVFAMPRKLTSLHQATKAVPNSFQILKCLIEHGANVVKLDESRKTFMHYFDRLSLNIYHYQLIIENFIPKNNLQLFSIAGGEELATTPLHGIVERHELLEQTLSLLYSSNVNFNAVDKKGDSVLAYAIKGKRAVAYLEKLITLCGADPTHLNKNGNSLLHIAAEFGTLHTMKFLADKEYCDVNCRNLDGNTPLHVASGDVRKFVTLIENGANVNSLNRLLETPLHHFKNLEITKLLIEHGADVYQKCNSCRIFLHNYLSVQYLTPSDFPFHLLVEYLVAKDLTSLFDINGGDIFHRLGLYRKQNIAYNPTPLLLSIRFLNPAEKTLRLLHSSGVNFKAEDGNGDSILAYAIRERKSLKFISTLIELGAEPSHLSKKYESLLHIAVRNGTAATLRFLLNLGLLDVNGKNSVGNTPLYIPMYINRKCDIVEKCKLLVEHGHDINSTNQYGQTALHVAAHCYDPETRLKVITYLISKNGNVFAKDSNGLTFLHHFVLHQFHETVPSFHSMVDFLLGKKFRSLIITPAIFHFPNTSSNLELKTCELTPLDLGTCGQFLTVEEKTISLLQSHNIPVPKTFTLPHISLQQFLVTTDDDDEHDVVTVSFDGLFPGRALI